MWRDSREWVQRFAYGVPMGAMESRPAHASQTGTRISFKYDTQIFSDSAEYDPEVIRRRLRELAFLNSNATMCFKCTQDGNNPIGDEYNYAGGIAEYVESMTAGGPTLHDCVHFKRQHESSEVGSREIPLPSCTCVSHPFKWTPLSL